MSETDGTWIQRWAQGGLAARAALLVGLFAAYLLCAAPVAWILSGPPGCFAAALSAAVCLISGWLAIFATSVIAPPDKPAAHVLVGMMIRMSLPLCACLIVTERSPGLTQAGFPGFLIAAFLLGLAVETWISVSQIPTNPVMTSPRAAGRVGEQLSPNASTGAIYGSETRSRRTS